MYTVPTYNIELVSLQYGCVTFNNVSTYGIMTSNFSFSSLLVEKLAILVQANPVLYNTLDANYKNISLRNSIWKDIAHETEKSGMYKTY